MANIKDYDPNKNTRCPNCSSERSIELTDYGNIYVGTGMAAFLTICLWLTAGTLLWIPILGWVALPVAVTLATIMSGLTALLAVISICIPLFARRNALITRKCTALNCGWTGTLKAARQAWTNADSHAISTVITFE